MNTEKKSIGYLPFGMTLALKVYDIIYGIEDQLEIGWSDEEKTFIVPILSSKRGHSYIEVNGEKYFLAEFIGL